MKFIPNDPEFRGVDVRYYVDNMPARTKYVEFIAHLTLNIGWTVSYHTTDANDYFLEEHVPVVDIPQQNSDFARDLVQPLMDALEAKGIHCTFGKDLNHSMQKLD